MVKVRELTESERGIILGQVRTGRRQRDIALAMGVSQSTVSHIAVKFRIHNTVSNLPRSGRPKVTSPREDRRMVRLAFQQRFTTGKNFNHKKSLTQKSRQMDSIFVAPLIKRTIVSLRGQGAQPFSDSTAIRRLRQAGVRPRRPLKRLRLEERYRNAGVQWATLHRWTPAQWRNVIFTDESRYRRFHPDGRLRVFRRNGERYENSNIQETEAFGGGSVMVWACITIGGRTELVLINGTLTSQLYVDEILHPHVLPFLGAIGQTAIF